ARALSHGTPWLHAEDKGEAFSAQGAPGDITQCANADRNHHLEKSNADPARTGFYRSYSRYREVHGAIAVTGIHQRRLHAIISTWSVAEPGLMSVAAHSRSGRHIRYAAESGNKLTALACSAVQVIRA